MEFPASMKAAGMAKVPSIERLHKEAANEHGGGGHDLHKEYKIAGRHGEG